MSTPQYDVVIVGGGISGTALLFLLSQYTDLKRIAIVEKLPEIAALNSHGRNNSQTLHCGDIETNYTLEKALQVKDSADMLSRYVSRFGGDEPLLHKYSKMALGVGEQECAIIRDRYKIFSPHYPGMRLLEADEIAQIEPNLMKNRQEEVLALGVLDQYTAVNFQKVAESFVTNAQQSACQTEVMLSTRVKSITQQEDKNFSLNTSKGELKSSFVVVSAGAHSLLFAQQMGYGHEYACLPVAGSFYYIPQLLNGKVYTVQNEKLPFAAIHGDPDILVPNKTRLGPTAVVLPVLERHNLSTLPDFLKVFSLDKGVLKTMGGLLGDWDILRYMLRNILFELPVIRRWLFLSDARKLIPSLKLRDISFAKGIGGIRPVMIDKVNAKLHLGEAKLNPGGGLIFNMTPSPGATSCLANAEKDMRTIASYLGAVVDEAQLSESLKVDS